MSKKCWWNDNNSKTLDHPEETLSQCHFLHLQSWTGWPGTERGLCCKGPAINHLRHSRSGKNLHNSIPNQKRMVYECSTGHLQMVE